MTEQIGIKSTDESRNHSAREVGLMRGKGLKLSTNVKIGDKVECIDDNFHAHEVVFGPECKLPKVGDVLTVRTVFERPKGASLRFVEIQNSQMPIECLPAYEDGDFEPAFYASKFKQQ